MQWGLWLDLRKCKRKTSQFSSGIIRQLSSLCVFHLHCINFDPLAFHRAQSSQQRSTDFIISNLAWAQLAGRCGLSFRGILLVQALWTDDGCLVFLLKPPTCTFFWVSLKICSPISFFVDWSWPWVCGGSILSLFNLSTMSPSSLPSSTMDNVHFTIYK